MPEFTEELTPSQIVAELDRYIVGQNSAKRAVAVALRNRYRRRLLPEDLRDEVIPKNILMIGPTGVGKTEIARRLATLARAPFIKVEATKFTEVGYVGRDVDSMVRDLLQIAIRLVETEKVAEVKSTASERAVDRILDIMQPIQQPQAVRRNGGEKSDLTRDIQQMMSRMFGGGATTEAPPVEIDTSAQDAAAQEERETDARTDRERRERIRARLRPQIVAGTLDTETVEITVEESQQMPFMQALSGQGMDEMGMDMQNAFSGVFPRKQKQRKVTIAEAKEIFAAEEAQLLIDKDSVVREAIQRTEQTGIIFVDEIDKIASTSRGSGAGGPDVSREGVQRDILPIIEGSTINTKHGPVRTDHILFIAAGAFHVSKPSDLIPELQGRLPIRVELENLTESDFKRILTEPRNALTRQYVSLLGTEGISVEFKEDGIAELARVAAEVNRRTENIGARRLHTILERLLEDVSFDASDREDKSIVIDAAYVHKRLDDIVKDEDLTRYIL
ncbi:MAG: ATP-dependent protease HslVU, ATPase subunit [Chthonomonadaceae bacterium]|nr:ATP-dependent protease HslVU, ATPase subunit [Chthonomonadaceae bacterium]